MICSFKNTKSVNIKTENNREFLCTQCSSNYNRYTLNIGITAHKGNKIILPDQCGNWWCKLLKLDLRIVNLHVIRRSLMAGFEE